MKARLLAATAALLIFTAPGFAEDKATTTTDTAGTTAAATTDNAKATMDEMAKVTTAQDFVTLAAMSDMFEIQTGQMAKKQAGGKAARKLGQVLVKDHSASSRELMKLAKAAKLDVKAPAALDQRHQVIADSLKDAKGEAFDTAFAQAQVQAHQEAIALFEAYGKNGDNAEIKAFATKGLPKLKEHLAMAQKIDGSAPKTQ